MEIKTLPNSRRIKIYSGGKTAFFGYDNWKTLESSTYLDLDRRKCDSLLNLIFLGEDIRMQEEVKLSTLGYKGRIELELKTKNLRELFNEMRNFEDTWVLNGGMSTYAEVAGYKGNIIDRLMKVLTPNRESRSDRLNSRLYKKTVKKVLNSSSDFCNYLSKILEKAEIQPIK